MNGHEEVVMILLEEKNVGLNRSGMYDQTPLVWAAGEGHGGVVKLLLEW